MRANYFALRRATSGRYTITLTIRVGELSMYDLIAAARDKFGELSAAEEEVVRAAADGEVAYCGADRKNDDPANNPANAASWGKERTVRARLIRWLCVDGEAHRHVDPFGIRIYAAAIGAEEESFDLSSATITFPLAFISCKFNAPLALMSTRLRFFSLEGSHLSELRADGADVAGSVLLRNGFHIAGDLSFSGAKIEGQLSFSHAQFNSGSKLVLQNTLVKQAFLWRDLGPDSPVHLDLRDASVGQIADDEQSWPRKGTLLLDGFVYQRIGEGPRDAGKRLEWLARQPDNFTPQPYRQLARVLRESGDDAGARDVLIAMEDARLTRGALSATQRIVHWMLRLTVGYGYKPLRALWYILFLVLLGTSIFSWGHNANVIVEVDRKSIQAYKSFSPFIYSLEHFLPLVKLGMTEHWVPDPKATPTPLLFPFSNRVAPAPAKLGTYIQWYLWAHILLGWFFTSMLVAGVTGLVKRE